MSVVPRLILICLFGLLVACEPVSQVPVSPSAVVGTRAIIKRHGQELTAEVTSVEGKLVTMEFQWQGEQVAVQSYYRGLYTVSGRGDGYHFEADFDEGKLEPLFPLATGKEVSFSGNSKDIDTGTGVDFWAHLHVIGEKTIDLPTGPRTVFVVDITTEYRKNDVAKRRIDTVYFDPELAMILKSVTREDNYQSFWRVISIERPGDGTTPPSSLQQRRSGTVMI